MIYGKPAITIEDDQTDRIGIRTLILSQMWQPSRWPLSIAELDDEGPGVPEVPGGVIFIGKQTRRQAGALRTFWTFEGINGDGKGVSFKTRANSPDFGFDPGFAEAPIQRHPKIEELLDTYEGQVLDEQIIWPLRLSGSDGGGPGSALSGNATQGSINPMFGRGSYFTFQGGTYWFRYAILAGSAIPDITGKLFGSGGLPGQAPRYTGRNWLGAGAPFQRRGPVLDVTELYWLSDEGGWPKPIYRAGSSTAQGGTP